MQIRTSPFVQELASAKRVTRGWVAYLIFLGCLFGVQGALWTGLPAMFPVEAGSPASQVQEAIANLASILVLFAWILLYERRSIASLGLGRPGRGVGVLLVGIVSGAAVISVPILFLWATGSYVQVEASATATTGWSALPLVLALAATVVVQGGNEELLTRGFLLQNQGWKLKWGWLAILLPALAFTIPHGVLGKPFALVTILGFALFASFVVLRTGSLWWVIGFHAGWNWTMGNIFAIPVSGLPPKSAALVYLEPASGAPDWLTGGEFGTEGGLPAAVVTVVITVIAYLLLRRTAATWPSPEAPQPGAPQPEASDTRTTG
ncbi:CPBP family intramembrane glutamic endopeptidase [Agromyces mangrovi Wang et al. 2018]|uniref:CPBP family intramembrane glutamic endopeptidase n=1 Tax=Agromyces mangrovi TaxID=1858653 RepID=UPI002573C015|nr:type II CAAX endopeptidase family protein [Agromyces mangrovi]BDZ65173.1 hypothetical protein GCM10025877_21110 [Agromyces mangrovi]